jgi:hypothetical protein
MSGGVLIVESKAVSPEQADAYRNWYRHTHVPEVLAIEGFASARLFEPVDGGSLLAIFELDSDVETAQANRLVARRAEPVEVDPELDHTEA